MTHEIAFLPLSQPFDSENLQPKIIFQSNHIKKLQQNNIHRGFMQISLQDFVASHRNSENCETCTAQKVCERCCYRFNACHRLPFTELIIKTGDALQNEINFEARLQQRIFAQFPENIPQCVGNYEEFHYYIRKLGVQKWCSAKICLFVHHCEDRLRKSSSLDLASQRQFRVEFDEICEQIDSALFELAILFNDATYEASNQMRIDWKDRDYCRKHNFFIVTTEDDGIYNYVFFDFGHNLCRSAS